MSDADGAPTPAPGRLTTSLRRGGGFAVVLVGVGLVWCIVQASGIARTPFHTRGEPREAVVVQDLLRTGNWILPRGNGRELPFKPPLFYWLSALAARARGGLDEASVRIPSAVLSGAAALALAGAATALYGPTGGLVGGTTLLTAFEWQRAAVSARVDMTLAFGLTLVFVALLRLRTSDRRGWLLLFYLGCAWATLSKGIPGLAVPTFQVALVCLLLDRNLLFLCRLRPIIGGAAVLAVTGAWYAAAAAQGGRDFASLVLHENVTRAVGAAHFTLGHRHSLGFLLAALVGGLMPWALLVPSVAVALWKDRRRIDRLDARLFALLWIAAVFTPYAIAASKRGVYLLALYPAVCLLIGWWAGRLAREELTAPGLRSVLQPIAWCLALAFAAVGLAAAAHAAGLPFFDTIASCLDPRAAADLRAVTAGDMRMLGVAAGVAATTAAVLAAATGSRRWGIALAAMVVCTSAVIAAATHVILPAVAESQTRRAFVVALRRALDDPAELHTTPSLDYGTLFYWNAALPEYERAAGTSPPRYLLLPEAAWLRMPAAERRAYERLPGLHPARGGNQGDVVVLQRVATDGGPPPHGS